MPHVVLIQPPSCDPTAPYLAVPMLTGFLRSRGVSVTPIDANVEAFDHLLSRASLERTRDRIDARFAQLNTRPHLEHVDKLEITALADTLGDAHSVFAEIDDAKATLRDEARFFDPAAYSSAVDTIDSALGVISAAYHPVHLDFTSYRTPFGLASADEIARSTGADHDPFHEWLEEVLLPRLVAAKADVLGISVCFPGQLQPAYAFGHALKRALPDTHLTFGGPGVTQMLLRLRGQRLAHALGPFDSACLFEGEHTLLDLVSAIAGERPLREVGNVVVRDKLMGARWIARHGMEDLRELPCPDFDGLPLDRYLSPRLVLPYDPTRGCYWGKCTFCHYGLAEVGTATYRERHVDRVVEHLSELKAKHQTRHFYFSQDSVAPKTIVKLAQAIVDRGLDIRWATDLKPEKYLTRERAETLRSAGAVACALGVESGSPRVLELIDKGAPIEVVGDVIDRLAGAGIAAEAMCFTEFPTETHDDAMLTLDFLAERRDRIGVYIVGEFGLTHGSLVAQEPTRFGIRETWELEGDELGLGIFFEPFEPFKTDEERERVDARLRDLSSRWELRPYPWAGAVSTAHTILYYDRFGPGVFRELAETAHPARASEVVVERELTFDLDRARDAADDDAAIWSHLVHEERRVSRGAYESLAREAPQLRPSRRPLRVRFTPGEPPHAVRSAPRGRRPSHAHNDAARHK